jgi:uncharacterized protein
MRGTCAALLCLGLSLAPILGLAWALPARADANSGFAAYERGDYATAFKEFLPLAEGGQASAQAAIGQMYLDGHGVEKDAAAAAHWLERAALGGNARAQAQIGTMYLIGEGVAADPVKAAHFTELAAGNDVARAQVDIAAMYYQGVGVAPDKTKAYFYALLAARQGNQEGEGLVQLVGAELSPSDRARAEAEAQSWQPGQKPTD